MPQSKKAMERERLSDQIRDFVFSWHNIFVDYWWRKKYSVPFGSSKHREMSLIDMSIEYIEDYEIRRAMERSRGIEEYDEDVGERMSEHEIDSEYDDLDIDDL